MKQQFKVFRSRESFHEAFGKVYLSKVEKGIAVESFVRSYPGGDPKFQGVYVSNLSHGFPKNWGCYEFWESTGNRQVLIEMGEGADIYCVVVPRVEQDLIATCGFSIGMDDEDMFDEYEREHSLKLDSSKVTEDAMKIEERMEAWLDYRYGSARNEGHGSDNALVGTLFIYRNMEDIEDVIDRKEPLCQSSGSWSEPDGIWEGLHYPDMWSDISIDFFELELEKKEE